MADYQITAVHVEHPGTHESYISHVEVAQQGTFTVSQIIGHMKSGHTFYHTVGAGRIAQVEYVPGDSYHREYIRTKPDSTTRDNLLSLRKF